MALNPGDQLGHYKIQSLIGKGGMGEVYSALDTKLDREVAIKVLPAALAGDPDRLSRFEREAKVLAQLNHPGIASIYGATEASCPKLFSATCDYLLNFVSHAGASLQFLPQIVIIPLIPMLHHPRHHPI